jgi:hypothetical protein
VLIEVKRRLAGTELRFECALLARSPRLLVALYRFEGARGPVDSYGLFWPHRPYLCYAMYPVRGGPPVFRFDVIRGLRVVAPPGAPLEVRYTDLLLDRWVEEGVPRWEDEDEVEAAVAAGRLLATDLARIDAARLTLERGHARILAEVEREVSSLERAREKSRGRLRRQRLVRQ